MKNPNFLILDEPTNDLDVFTLAALEEYLLQYPGCLLIVSHDRYFLDKLVDHLFVLDNGEVKDILGSYIDFRELLKSEKTVTGEKPRTERIKTPEAKLKLTFKEKFELESLEKEIPLLEEKKRVLEQQLHATAADHEALLLTSEELSKVVEELDTKSFRWLELSEKTAG
jgi:ATP-binding cassette subfamily F protein uup